MELIRIGLFCTAFIGIILLVKIILIAHKDRQQQIKEVIQRIRNRR